MYGEQLEFPFMTKPSALKVGVKYKGFAYRGTKSLVFDKDTGLYVYKCVHILKGPNGDEVPYFKKDNPDSFETSKGFREYVETILEVAPPL